MRIMKHKPDKGRPLQDKRFFVRIENVFPVDFRVINEGRLPKGSVWMQGYTCNLSRGGICLETVYLTPEILALLEDPQTSIELNIRIPFTHHAIRSESRFVWFRAQKEDNLIKYSLGLKFYKITISDLNRLIRCARWFRVPRRLLVKTLIFLVIGIFCALYYGFNVKQQNRRLVERFVQLKQAQTKEKAVLKNISLKKDEVVAQIERQTSQALDAEQLKIRYKQLLLEERMISDRIKLMSLKEDSMRKEILDDMYGWIRNHQSISTGLIKSFEGDVGIIKDWAFIYDQALAVNVFLIFKDYPAAEHILDFFIRKLDGRFQGFANAYYYDSEDIAEFTVHCGPNIWIGVAAMQYQEMTGNDEYLELAEKVAQWLISIQDADPAGGIKGGPGVRWFATEHNLDAYAFFSMLYMKTQKPEYATARKKVLSWLQNHAMVPHDRDYLSPPVNRGLGDSTVATDTYAWSLAALGPEKLESLGMDPEAIMQYAQKHCGVTVSYQRPSGHVIEVSGFDFAKISHMPRGGMVSPEWTAQMVVSYQMLGEYFKKKDETLKRNLYEQKAAYYLDELNKLIITSSSSTGKGKGCLPYATLEDADTGHGWNTPLGAHTCSIAGTAYTVMAMKKFNPLMFSSQLESK